MASQLSDKKIALVVNDYDPRSVDAQHRLRIWCEQNGVTIVPETARYTGSDQAMVDTAPSTASGATAHVMSVANSAEDSATIDLVVALGGDGTIIRAVHEYASNETPILGIKFGRLGFLSGAPAEELLEAVEAALHGQAQVERRALLEVNAYSDDTFLNTHYALNEAVIGRHSNSEIVSTQLMVNGQVVYQLRGNGLIVSTATGSTAYALSAGGPILSPESRAMVLVPLASHTLINRSIVTAPKDLVRIDIAQSDVGGVILSIDGTVVIDNVHMERSEPATYAPLTHIEARICSKRWVSLVKTSSRLFFDTLSTEFYRHEA